MYKAFSLFLCLLVCTPTVGAQQGIPPRREPGPAAQGTPVTRGLTPEEQRARIRALIEEHRPRAQRPVPTWDQYTPPAVAQELGPRRPAPSPYEQVMAAIHAGAATKQGRARQRAVTEEFLARTRGQRPAPTPEQPSLGGWVLGPSAVAPPGPIPTLSDEPAIGDWGVSSLKEFYGISFWSEADEAKLNQNLGGLNLNLDAITKSVEGLKEINWPTAPNLPPAFDAEDDTFPSLPTASAASHGPVRAQASSLLPKFVEKLFTKRASCEEKCELVHTKCVNKEIGPKGGYSTYACQVGRSACKRTCPKK